MALTGGYTNFTYDGLSSKDFGVIAVQIGSGMYEDQFHSSRSINDIKMKNQDNSILQNIEEEVRSFPLTIAFEKTFTDAMIEKVILWLFQDSYKPLYFEDNPNKIVYAIAEGDSTIVHNGLKQGYITMNMKTNSTKLFSPIKNNRFTVITVGQQLSIINSGHEIIYPEISIVKTGAGKISIENLSDKQSAIFELSRLVDKEDIYLNSERELVETKLLGVYHYDDIQGDFPRLVKGNNIWKVTGNCSIEVRFKEKYKF